MPVGGVESVAETIAETGPILFPGLNTTTGERTLVLDHQGDDPTRGWRVYLAYPADADPSCAVTQVRGTDRFTDCDGDELDVTELARPTDACPIVEKRQRISIGLGGRRLPRGPTAHALALRTVAPSERASAELLAVRLELAAVQRQPADDVGAGGLHGAGQPVEALARVEGERAEHRRPLAAHRRQVGDLRRRPRCLADDEQPVHPRPDEHDVGVLDRRVVGLADRCQRVDRPTLLAEPAGDQLGRLPRVPGEALDEHGGPHRPNSRGPCGRSALALRAAPTPGRGA